MTLKCLIYQTKNQIIDLLQDEIFLNKHLIFAWGFFHSA